jgi:hypothetical protein
MTFFPSRASFAQRDSVFGFCSRPRSVLPPNWQSGARRSKVKQDDKKMNGMADVKRDVSTDSLDIK